MCSMFFLKMEFVEHLAEFGRIFIGLSSFNKIEHEADDMWKMEMLLKEKAWEAVDQFCKSFLVIYLVSKE